MHIFSLLSFLKQVCNHPALAAGKLEDYESYESTKWDLFCELLDESIGSGEKVVIFTQFLGMIEIFRLYLEKKGIGHVILTGATRNRDKIIKQFSEDVNCKVFVGSLKAGGVGIDLVAASVLIHYDRWWNAAREDQATDRVHRFGQKRVVQILKLVTEGTVEERIGAIIDRKRMLSAEILVEDAPESIKSFSRDELLELLS
jgi:SNF2 family DNA or RNA helicase